jgi:hypothetical protein
MYVASTSTLMLGSFCFSSILKRNNSNRHELSLNEINFYITNHFTKKPTTIIVIIMLVIIIIIIINQKQKDEEILQEKTKKN